MFARPSIPRHIFIEGRLLDIIAALKGLVTVYNTQPRLIPPDQRVALLSPRNPLSSGASICGGEWVRCLHGLYRGDVGLVCNNDLTREASLTVALVPWIPANAVTSTKRTRPDPRRWSANQLEAVWGKRHVRRISTDEYEFGHETYRSGLVFKHLPPASVVVVDAPTDIGPFAEAPYIGALPFRDSLARRYAQHSITVGQWVRVISGEQRSLVGQPSIITDGVADLVPQDDGVPPLQVPLEHLMPVYRPGDHVKYRWSDAHGIIISVDENDLVSFINSRTRDGVCTYGIALIAANHIFQFITPAYCMTLYTPPHHFYQFKQGTWVEFHGPKDTERPKRRGWVHSVEDARAIVVDERMQEEVREQTHIKSRLSFMLRSSG